MKVLLDENIDVRFKHHFEESEHQFFTVRDMNWTGKKNGELFSLLKQNGFSALIAVDKQIPFQQNLTTIGCFVIILDVAKNILPELLPYVPLILRSLSNPSIEKLVVLKI